MQYLATGNDKFLGQNYAATFAGSSGSVHNISMCADVTDDIGLQLNTVKSEIVTKKLDFLFIDNEAYLGFAGGVRIFNSEHPNGIHNYKLDLANDKFFDSKSREKWEYRFTKELKNLDKLIANSNGKYQKQFEKLDEEYKQIQLLANKLSEFKVKLKAVKEKFFKNNLIYYSKDLSILLAKYLGLDEVIIFCTTLRGSTEFDEVLLCYKNYLIELCRGELNQFVPEANEKEFVIAKAVFNKDEYYKNGYYKPLIEKYNYKIVRQGFYKFNREKMNDLFEDEKMQFKSLYEYLK